MYIYIYIWRRDVKYPGFVKESKKVTMSEKVGYDRTSFRSPIRSISELRTKFDHFSAWNRVPRLCGCSKNMHKHKRTVKR